jgi:SAM-dependent methyltransferase
VDWIHHSVLSGRPSRILDLGCGPGLYTSQLARLGHECVGIDFSPSSISYAMECAHRDNLRCSYVQHDLRVADYGQGYGLVMFIFGEFNVFRPADARTILAKAHQALAENGQLLLEVHTFTAVRALGERPASWYSTESGLFLDRPHICLAESFWDAGLNAATERYLVLDGLAGILTRYAASTQAYTDRDYQSLLAEHDFEEVVFHPSLGGESERSQRDFRVVVSQKRAAD